MTHLFQSPHPAPYSPFAARLDTVRPVSEVQMQTTSFQRHERRRSACAAGEPSKIYSVTTTHNIFVGTNGRHVI